MKKQESMIRILGLLLIADCVVLAYVPFLGWVSTGRPTSGWSPFFDCLRFYDGSGDGLPFHRLFCVTALSGVVFAMCFRRAAVSLALALASAYFVLVSLPHLGHHWVHPLGFAALVVFFALSVSLFVLHVKTSHDNNATANNASHAPSGSAPGAVPPAHQG